MHIYEYNGSFYVCVYVILQGHVLWDMCFPVCMYISHRDTDKQDILLGRAATRQEK